MLQELENVSLSKSNLFLANTVFDQTLKKGIPLKVLLRYVSKGHLQIRLNNCSLYELFLTKLAGKIILKKVDKFQFGMKVVQTV